MSIFNNGEFEHPFVKLFFQLLPFVVPEEEAKARMKNGSIIVSAHANETQVKNIMSSAGIRRSEDILLQMLEAANILKNYIDSTIAGGMEVADSSLGMSMRLMPPFYHERYVEMDVKYAVTMNEQINIQNFYKAQTDDLVSQILSAAEEIRNNTKVLGESGSTKRIAILCYWRIHQLLDNAQVKDTLARNDIVVESTNSEHLKNKIFMAISGVQEVEGELSKTVFGNYQYAEYPQEVVNDPEPNAKLFPFYYTINFNVPAIAILEFSKLKYRR